MNLHEQMVFAYQNAPAVRALFDRAGLTPDDIHEVNDLSQLPVTSKDDLIEMQAADPPFGGWNAVPVEEVGTIYLSPGPLFDAHDDGRMVSSIRLFQKAGFGKGDIVINAFLYHMVPAGMLFHEALMRAGATVVPMGPGNTDVQVQVMMALNATGYCGTPSFLSIILDKAEEMHIPKDALPLKKAFFSAEPYPNSLRQRFEGEYGMQTSQAYATADIGVISYQLPGETDFAFREDLIVQLVDPNTGETVPHGTPGEVVVTTFSKVYPLTRFGTGDMAVMTPNSDRMFGLVGRSGEAVKVRGMFLHPNQLNFVLPQIKHVKAWEAVVSRQNNRDYLTINVTTDGPVNPEEVRQFARQTAHLTVDEVNVVDAVEQAGRVRDVRDWS